MLLKCFLVLIIVVGLGLISAPLFLWSLFILGFLFYAGCPMWLFSVIACLLVAMNIPLLRKMIFTTNVMKVLTALKLMPVISQTERIALEAGTIWVDGELFSGKPDIEKLRSQTYGKLSPEEQSFLDNEVATVSKMVDNYKAYKDGDLQKEVWDYLKEKKFLGLIIPKEYGGHGFSALGHSEIIATLATSSIPLTISVMVPNSLGPAELLIHYGTDEQKNYYLPRLANGTEIPCFGLTELHAGSDAGAMQSKAVVFRGADQKLYLRVNWKKRYITLGAMASILGIAVRLSDPDELLGKGKDVGITCMLIPSDAKGVILGRRHNPLGVPFINSPIEGRDVVISIDQVIGGVNGAGNGWQMLMECLAAGRGISLPAQAAGGAKYITKVSSAYSLVRNQFGMSIGKFEGIQEKLGHMGAMTYLLEATRIYTVGAIDKGMKPAVVTAIVKCYSTEIARKLASDSMDILGGSAISLGPKNLVADKYIAAPIAITVEGANILTRTLIIFGQGAIRCHPFAYQEVVSLMNNDVDGFDKAFLGHVGHVVSNKCRAYVSYLTRGHHISVGNSTVGRYYQKLSWVSSSYALLADIAMASLGGKLKEKEMLTGRFADILSWMYMITASLRRFESEGSQKQHRLYVDYICQYGFNQIQQAFEGIYKNFDAPVIGFLFKKVVAHLSKWNSFSDAPSDNLLRQITKGLLRPDAAREELFSNVLTASNPYFVRLELAMKKSYDAQIALKKISDAMKIGLMPKGKPLNKLDEALKLNILDQVEFDLIKESIDLRSEVMEVDSYAVEDLAGGKLNGMNS